jgi:hypothetical protein
MQPGWGRDASTAQGRSLRDRPCFAQHDSRAYGLARRAPRDAAAALDDFLEGGFGIHVPFPGVFESHDLGTGAGAVFFGEEDVVVLAAVEGRVEVDEVDGLVLDVLAEDGEVVAVIQLVLLHCRAILAGMLWGGNLIVGVVPAGSVPSYWAYLGLTSGAIICRPYGAWVGSRRRAGSWALRPDGTGPPDSRGRLSLHLLERLRRVGRDEVKILRCRLEVFPPFARDERWGSLCVFGGGGLHRSLRLRSGQGSSGLGSLLLGLPRTSVRGYHMAPLRGLVVSRRWAAFREAAAR